MLLGEHDRERVVVFVPPAWKANLLEWPERWLPVGLLLLLLSRRGILFIGLFRLAAPFLIVFAVFAVGLPDPVPCSLLRGFFCLSVSKGFSRII